MSELKTTNLGNELSFVIGVHYEAKNSLKSLAFTLISATRLLPTFSGGINGIFCIFFSIKESFQDRPIYSRACG